MTMVISDEAKPGNVVRKAEIRGDMMIFLALRDEGKRFEVFHHELLCHFTNLFQTIKKTKFILFIQESSPFKQWSPPIFRIGFSSVAMLFKGFRSSLLDGPL